MLFFHGYPADVQKLWFHVSSRFLLVSALDFLEGGIARKLASLYLVNCLVNLIKTPRRGGNAMTQAATNF